MHICFVSDVLGKNIGGAENSSVRWINKLLERGHKITVLTAVKNPKTLIKHKNLKVFKFHSLRLKNFNKNAYLASPLFLMGTNKLIKILKNVDIIHITLVPSLLAFTIIFIANFIKKPIIISNHVHAEVLYYYLKIPLSLEKFSKIYYSILCNLFFNKCDITIGPSYYSIKILKKFGFKSMSKIISNGIDRLIFNENINPKPFLKRYKINKNLKKVLFVGRLHKDKNLDILIKAANIVTNRRADVLFIIVGEGIGKKRLKLLVKKLNLSKSFLFTGFIPDNLLPSAYAVADVFVLPSFSEIQGIVLLEAAATGKVLIGSNSTAIKELVINGYNGYTFKINNFNDLAQKILKVLNTEQLAKNLSVNSIKLAKKHDINKSIDKLEKVYKTLLKH